MSEILRPMETSIDMKANTSDGFPFLTPGPLHSAITAFTVDGMAENSTEIASTVISSSSLDKCASFAASRSSEAIPNETEKLRSELRLPSAPVVAMTSSRLISLSQTDSMAIRSPVNRLATMLIVLKLALRAKRGNSSGIQKKPARRRHAEVAGIVYGCVFEQLLSFVNYCTEFGTGETIHHFKLSLCGAGRRCAKARGEDAIHLARGFANFQICRKQNLLLSGKQAYARIDSKYGNRGAVVGASVAVFFALCALARKDVNCAALMLCLDGWLCNILSEANDLRGCSESASAISAERRALERLLCGARAAFRWLKTNPRDTHNALKFVLRCMENSAWPDRVLDEESQPYLINWINSDAFTREVDEACPATPRPVRFNFEPRSGGSHLFAALEAGSEDGSDTASCTSSTSGSGASSCSSHAASR